MNKEVAGGQGGLFVVWTSGAMGGGHRSVPTLHKIALPPDTLSVRTSLVRYPAAVLAALSASFSTAATGWDADSPKGEKVFNTLWWIILGYTNNILRCNIS